MCQVFKKLTTFFKSIGVKAIFDTSCSRDLTLIEACNEFIARYRQSQSENEEKCKSSVPMISSACPGIVFGHLATVILMIIMQTHSFFSKISGIFVEDSSFLFWYH